MKSAREKSNEKKCQSFIVNLTSYVIGYKVFQKLRKKKKMNNFNLFMRYLREK